MKVKLFLVAFLCFLASSVFAQLTSDSIKVYGNCGMCKKRIEKAVKLNGVSYGSWNSETKELVLLYDENFVSKDMIEHAVADAGHDTEHLSADNKVYSKLPACCLYERKKIATEQKQ
jgi:periplasmic mercuric ion binding protein